MYVSHVYSSKSIHFTKRIHQICLVSETGGYWSRLYEKAWHMNDILAKYSTMLSLYVTILQKHVITSCIVAQRYSEYDILLYLATTSSCFYILKTYIRWLEVILYDIHVVEAAFLYNPNAHLLIQPLPSVLNGCVYILYRTT